MANLGSLIVTIGADHAPLKRGLDSAKSDVTGFTNSVRQQIGQSAADSFKGFADSITPARVALAAMAGAAGLGLVVKRTLEANSAQTDMAYQLGVTQQRLSEMQFAMGTAGVSADKTNLAMQKMSTGISEAARVASPARDALKELGLNAGKLADMAPDEQFRKIADALKLVGNEGDKARIMGGLVGEKLGPGLLVALSMGSKGLDEMGEKARKLNIAMSETDSAKVKAAADAFDMTGQALKGIANSITIVLAPYIEELANRFVDVSANANGFRDEALATFEAAAKAVGFFADTLHNVHIVFNALELGVKVLGTAVWTTFEGIGDLLSTSVNGWLMMINVSLEAVNSAFGTTFTKIAMLENPLTKMGQAMRADVVKSAVALDKLAGQKLTSASIAEFFDAVRNKADAAAVATVNSREQFKAHAELVDTEAVTRAQALRDAQAQQFFDLQTSLNTEFEAENEAYMRRQEILGISLNAKLIDQQRYQVLAEKMALGHQNKLFEIEAKAAAAQAALQQQKMQWIMTANESIFGNLANLMNSKHKEMFEIGKAAALAEAFVNTQLAAIKAYQAVAAIPFVGPALAPIAAAAALAAGAVTMENIAGASFSGGGKSGGGRMSSLGGASGAAMGFGTPQTVQSSRSTEVEPVAAREERRTAPTILVQLDGESYTRAQVIALMEKINEVTSDGGGVQAA